MKQKNTITIIATLILLSFVYFLVQLRQDVRQESRQALATPAATSGIWVSQSEIMSRPTTGAAWNSILSDAAGSWGTANVSNQDSDHDQYVLAGALVCARTGQYCDKTRLALLSAIGTEEGARWLAVGRNMLGYTIAADVMRNSGNLTGADLTSVSNWLANFLTRTLANNNSGVQEKLTPLGSGSNASAQEGAVYAAIAAYTGNSEKLEYVWNRFRLYSCDKTGNPEQVIDVNTGFSSGWSFATAYNEACAVNPIGTTKDGVRIDGAIINDMRRGGSFKFPPGHTTYPWVGLEGYVPAALILQRAGYPAFEIKDQAVLRTHEYLCYLKNNTTTDWWEPSRAAEVKHLVKVVYGFDTCDVAYPVGGGRTVGYTDWTHPLGSSPVTPSAVTPSRTPTRTPTVTASPSQTATITPTRTATVTMTNTVPPPGSLTCVLVTWTRGLNLRPTESMDNAPYQNMNFGYGANFPVQRIFWDEDGNRWMQVNEHIYAAMYLVSNGKTYAIPWPCPQG